MGYPELRGSFSPLPYKSTLTTDMVGVNIAGLTPFVYYVCPALLNPGVDPKGLSFALFRVVQCLTGLDYVIPGVELKPFVAPPPYLLLIKESGRSPDFFMPLTKNSPTHFGA